MEKHHNTNSLYISQLDSKYNTNCLSLGAKEYTPLKTFLKNTALDFYLNNIAKTYVLINDSNKPRIYSYLTLMCSELTVEGIQKPQDSANTDR